MLGLGSKFPVFAVEGGLRLSKTGILLSKTFILAPFLLA